MTAVRRRGLSSVQVLLSKEGKRPKRVDEPGKRKIARRERLLMTYLANEWRNLKRECDALETGRQCHQYSASEGPFTSSRSGAVPK